MYPTEHGHEPQPTQPVPPIEPYRPQSPHRGKQRPKRTPIIIAFVVILLVAAAGGSLWYFKFRANPASTRVSPPPAQVKTTPVAPESDADAVPAGKTNYVSSQQNLNLSFEYPTSWIVSPKQTTPAATTPITITSPSTTIAAADGTSTTGRVVVTIRPGGGQIGELVSATAAQDSVQIGYTKPTATQRQYPFLTFVHLAAGSKTAGAFEEVMITGGQQFKKTDVISSDNLGSIDPLITAGFFLCPTTECPATGPPTLGIASATWQNAPLFRQAEAIITSLKLN